MPLAVMPETAAAASAAAAPLPAAMLTVKSPRSDRATTPKSAEEDLRAVGRTAAADAKAKADLQEALVGESMTEAEVAQAEKHAQVVQKVTYRARAAEHREETELEANEAAEAALAVKKANIKRMSAEAHMVEVERTHTLLEKQQRAHEVAVAAAEARTVLANKANVAAAEKRRKVKQRHDKEYADRMNRINARHVKRKGYAIGTGSSGAWKMNGGASPDEQQVMLGGALGADIAAGTVRTEAVFQRVYVTTAVGYTAVRIDTVVPPSPVTIPLHDEMPEAFHGSRAEQLRAEQLRRRSQRPASARVVGSKRWAPVLGGQDQHVDVRHDETTVANQDAAGVLEVEQLAPTLASLGFDAPWASDNPTPTPSPPATPRQRPSTASARSRGTPSSVGGRVRSASTMRQRAARANRAKSPGSVLLTNELTVRGMINRPQTAPAQRSDTNLNEHSSPRRYSTPWAGNAIVHRSRPATASARPTTVSAWGDHTTNITPRPSRMEPKAASSKHYELAVDCSPITRGPESFLRNRTKASRRSKSPRRVQPVQPTLRPRLLGTRTLQSQSQLQLQQRQDGVRVVLRRTTRSRRCRGTRLRRWQGT